MQAFEAIEISQLVTVTGGEDPGSNTFQAEGTLSGETPIGFKANGQGKVSQTTGEKSALFDRTVGCVEKLKDKPFCLDVLKTVTGQGQTKKD